ncbi:uncharacterized protein LOC115718781 [Cannabis sativa]|uniref:uncharacterized protein LOC115718781 n=1 Tax=Cannabis sativa TaxID=3483 RepID=UPI0011DF85CD|nr:uncharacterized protein LOC115718781 [Cannabis sativa]XP_060967035.1 uncharacterized protein LOC115718781 [Cannabis sativa]
MVRFCDLPSEVVEKIMLLVPADSLVECKSVNKFWYSCISTFIKDPKFVAKHLLVTKTESFMSLLCFKDPSPHEDHCLITYPLLTINHVDGDGDGDDDDDVDDDDVTIIHDGDDDDEDGGSDYDDVTIIPDDDGDNDDDDGGGGGDDDGKKDHFTIVTAYLTIPLLDMNRWDRIYHCNGLLLLVNYSYKKTITMVLCNPVLKESMILPKPKNVTFVAHHHHYIGFEHDSRNNKYKCVSLWLGDEEECKVEVYTLGSDSWREINMSQDVMDYIAQAEVTELCNGVCFGGVCYWCISQLGIEKILSFDMSSEEFRMIDLPRDSLFDIEDWSDNYILCLAVWNDSVVMSLTPNFTWKHDDPYHDESILLIFTMDKGVAGGWTKYEQVGPLEKYYNNLLPFWKNNEILMEVFEDGSVEHLASCNIRTQKLRNVVFDRVRKINLRYGWVCLYEKSLISIRRE